MASTYVATNAGTGVQPHAGIGVHTAYSSYELTAALVVDDVIQMLKVPIGAIILDVVLSTDDLDTSGSPTLVLDVGDGDNDDRLISASTVGQAGGVAYMDEIDALLYQYTADDTIDVSVKTAPATGASSGTINLAVTYTMAQK